MARMISDDWDPSMAPDTGEKRLPGTYYTYQDPDGNWLNPDQEPVRTVIPPVPAPFNPPRIIGEPVYGGPSSFPGGEVDMPRDPTITGPTTRPGLGSPVSALWNAIMPGTAHDVGPGVAEAAMPPLVGGIRVPTIGPGQISIGQMIGTGAGVTAGRVVGGMLEGAGQQAMEGVMNIGEGLLGGLTVADDLFKYLNTREQNKGLAMTSGGGDPTVFGPSGGGQVAQAMPAMGPGVVKVWGNGQGGSGPIVGGMLADGRLFALKKNGTVKVYRPPKNTDRARIGRIVRGYKQDTKLLKKLVSALPASVRGGGRSIPSHGHTVKSKGK